MAEPAYDIAIGQYSRETISLVLRDALGNPIDLNAAQQVFFYAQHQTSRTRIGGEATVVLPTRDPISNLPTGRVDYAPTVADVANAGDYFFQVRIIWLGLVPQTIPSFRYRQMRILPALAGAPA